MQYALQEWFLWMKVRNDFIWTSMIIICVFLVAISANWFLMLSLGMGTLAPALWWNCHCSCCIFTILKQLFRNFNFLGTEYEYEFLPTQRISNIQVLSLTEITTIFYKHISWTSEVGALCGALDSIIYFFINMATLF